MLRIRVAGTIAPVLLGLATHVGTPAAPRVPLTLTLGVSSVVGGNSTTATITLDAPAPDGGANITVTNPPGTTVRAGASQSGRIQNIGSTRIAVLGGQRQATIDILTAGVATPTTATITAAFGGAAVTATLTIAPAKPRSVVIAPTSVTGGQAASATVILDGAAPMATGVAVSLAVVQGTGTTSDGSVRSIGPSAAAAVASVPTSVQFPPGASSMTASIATTAVSQNQPVAITATLGSTSVSGTLTIKPPVVTQVQLAPPTVVSGTASNGTVVLNGPAPAAGLRVALSVNGSGATTSPFVIVPSGAGSATFPISTGPKPGEVIFAAGSANSLATTAVISARAGLTANAPVTITDGSSNTIQAGEAPAIGTATLTILPPPTLHSMTAAPAAVPGGDAFTLVLVLTPSSGSVSGATTLNVSAPAVIPAGTVSIDVDQPALVQLPTGVAVTSGSNTVTLSGKTTTPSADATVAIHASYGSTKVLTLLLVKAPALASFTLRPTSVTGGQNLIASFKLSPSASSPTVVSLSTDRPDLIELPATLSVPVSVVPTPFTFRTHAVTAETGATITATVGAQRVSVTLTLMP